LKTFSKNSQFEQIVLGISSIKRSKQHQLTRYALFYFKFYRSVMAERSITLHFNAISFVNLTKKILCEKNKWFHAQHTHSMLDSCQLKMTVILKMQKIRNAGV